MATAVKTPLATCKTLNSQNLSESGWSFLRKLIENNQTTTKSEATMWTCVNPIAKSIHSKVFSGESGRIPKTQATKRDRVNTTQKRTAGPRCGPLAQRIHREVGILICDRILATSSGISMAGKAMKLAMGLSSVHSIRTSCEPGCRLNKT